jgi:DNA (cytosine-5)-methyltransferase 1
MREEVMKKPLEQKSEQLISVVKKPTFIDIFAGCGGLSLGLLQAGWQGLFAIERNSDAFQTLKHNLINSAKKPRFDWCEWLPKSNHSVEDIIEKNRANLISLRGQVDLLVGGPPCQGFSTAGRRDPNDPRNQLIKTYLEFVEIVQPKIVLIENVKGITSDFSDEDTKINYADWLIKALSRKYTVHSQILDTSTFGVPQKRHRFFLIAFRKGVALKTDLKPFIAIENNRVAFLLNKGISSVPVSIKDAISDLEVKLNGTAPSRDTKGFQELKYTKPLSEYQEIMNLGTGNLVSDTRLAKHKPSTVERFEKMISLSIELGRLNMSLSKEIKAGLGLKKSSIRVLDPNSPSPTITSMPDDLIHYREPRALTVRENARLQGFPDWFEFKGQYTTGGDRRKFEVPRFTQVANAVPPLIAEAIGLSLFRYLV